GHITAPRGSPPVDRAPAARGGPARLVAAGRSAARLRPGRAAVIGATLAAIAAGFLAFILVRSPGQHPGVARGWPSALGGAIYRRPYVTDNAVYVSDADGHVSALDAATGRRLWVYPAKGHIGSVYSRPTVAGGTVYFGSLSGTVYAIDEKTGRPEWQARTGASLRSNLQYVKGVI